MEKGEIGHFEQLHLFPQSFPKTFFFDVFLWLGVLSIMYQFRSTSYLPSILQPSLFFRHSVFNQYFPLHFPLQPCITATSNFVLCFGWGSYLSLTNSGLPVIYFLFYNLVYFLDNVSNRHRTLKGILSE